jgi:hypothetical protein
MEKRKTYPGICVLIGALLLLFTQAKAQVSAQTDFYDVLEGACSHLDILANDNIQNPDSLQITVQPQHGSVFVDSSNRGIIYCPNPGYLGADQFTYRIVQGAWSDVATVYINVLQHNNYTFAGDADQNGKVEHFDVLSIGLAYNMQGPARFNAASANALAWEPSPYSNTNPGAADCNGDGIVDNNDMVEVQTMYGDTFPIQRYDVDTSKCGLNPIPFFIKPVGSDTVQDGEILDVDFYLGDNGTTNEAYGIAFTLEFDRGIIPGSNVQFLTNNSWLLNTNAGLFFNKSFQGTGEMEIALTRTDHNNSSGGGPFLRARLPIIDNIDGIADNTHHVNLMLKKVRLITNYNTVEDVCLQQPSILYYKTFNAIEKIEETPVNLYPNPSTGLVTIEAPAIRGIEITDLAGRRLYAQQTQATDRLQLDVQQLSLPTGAYLVRITTNYLVNTKKLFVQH